MPTELEQPPVVEINETIIEMNDIPDMHAHLYNGRAAVRSWTSVALCGIQRDQDAHARYHDADGTEPTVWDGHTACPRCGAVCCPTCLERA